MKKILLILGILVASFGLYAQSAEYTRYLNQAKTYETQKKWCHALGAYYDALVTDDDPEVKQEAWDAYKELRDTILSGNPGKGNYNLFDKHDEWKKLLMDAEKYGSSIAKYALTIGELERQSLDYNTKTASYSATVKQSVSDRYKKTIDIIKSGYIVTYRKDYSADLPKPEDWPLYSVSSKRDAVYNVGGALVFAKKTDYWSGELAYYNAFAASTILYDYKFSIVNEAGTELVRAKRFLLGAEGDSIVFEGITPAVMDLIDSGKAFVKPVGVYLEYGAYNRDDDKGGRSFIKNFPEVQLDLNNAVFCGKNHVGDVKRENFKKIYLANTIKMIEIPDRNYSVSNTEVTQEQYEAVMGQNPSYFVNVLNLRTI